MELPPSSMRHQAGVRRKYLKRKKKREGGGGGGDGVAPGGTCPQDMWVAATLHPDCLLNVVEKWEGAWQPLSLLALHADNLAQRVYHVDQIALRFHHGVDRLVRHRRFVDDVRIFTAFDAGCCLSGIVEREAAPGFVTRHGTSGSMATAHEAF